MATGPDGCRACHGRGTAPTRPARRPTSTPPDSTSSSSGRTSWRRRTRVKRGSALCGSSHTSSPAQAVRVVVRRTVSSGRSHGGSHRRMPASERAPDPRPRPRSTVSAWSSRVWPSRIGLSACGRAAQSAAWRARRAAASIPPGPVTSTACTRAAIPRSASSATVAAARSADPSWSRWSTTTARTSSGPRTAAAAMARASESAPPEQPTTNGARRAASGRAASASRTARRTSKTAVVTTTRSHGCNENRDSPSRKRRLAVSACRAPCAASRRAWRAPRGWAPSAGSPTPC